MTDRPTLRLDVEGVEIARTVGPTAWLVLGALNELADESGRARVSVRLLATELGLAPDTVATALRGLKAHGYVVRVVPGQHHGRFAHGGYELHLPIEEQSMPPRPKTRRRSTVEQLSLLDGSSGLEP